MYIRLRPDVREDCSALTNIWFVSSAQYRKATRVYSHVYPSKPIDRILWVVQNNVNAIVVVTRDMTMESKLMLHVVSALSARCDGTVIDLVAFDWLDNKLRLVYAEAPLVDRVT